MTKLKKIYDFYSPLQRSVVFDGTLVNPITGEIYSPPSRTKQSFMAECDINNIMKEFKITGQIRHISAQAALGAFLELDDPVDFQESLHIIERANNSFASLPSLVRKRFNNNPAEFLQFMSDPNNRDEALKLGLLDPPTSPPPTPAPDPTPTPPNPNPNSPT